MQRIRLGKYLWLTYSKNTKDKEEDNIKIEITPDSGYSPPVYAEVTHNGSPWSDFDCTPIGNVSEVIIYSADAGTYIITATCEEA